MRVLTGWRRRVATVGASAALILSGLAIVAAPAGATAVADGVGTNVVAPLTAEVGSTNNTETFTYSAGSGTIFGESYAPFAVSNLSDGSATTLAPNGPRAIALDSFGDLFVVSAGSQSIQVLASANRTIFGQNFAANVFTTLAPGGNAITTLSSPGGLIFDSAGDLFLTNYGTNQILVIPSSTHTIFGETYTANTVSVLTNGNGSAITGLNEPNGITFDSAGDLFVTNSGSSTVTVLPATSKTLFGESYTANTAANLTSGTGTSLSSILSQPLGVAVDSQGDLLVANLNTNAVVVMASSSSNNIFGRTYSANTPATLTNGDGSTISLSSPRSIHLDPSGNLYISNYNSGYTTILPATTTTLFGQTYTADVSTPLRNGAGSSIGSSGPRDMTFDSSGDLFIDNYTGNTIQVVPASTGVTNGAVSIAVPSGWTAPQTTSATSPGYTTASTGTVSASGQVITVSGLTLATDSSVTVTYGDTSLGAHPGAAATAPSTLGTATWTTEEESNSTGSLTPIYLSPSVDVVAVSPDGSGSNVVSPSAVPAGSTTNTETFAYTSAPATLFGQTVTAGNAQTLTNGNGSAISLSQPYGDALDAQGNLFIANSYNNTITVVPSATETIFGQSFTANTAAVLVPSGGALSLNGSFQVALDAAGDLFIDNYYANTITVVTATNKTLFGQSFVANTPQVLAPSGGALGLNHSNGLTFDASGDLFITDNGSNVILVVPSATKSIFGNQATANTPFFLKNPNGSYMTTTGGIGGAFDAQGDFFVGNLQSSTVSVIAASSNLIFGVSYPANTMSTIKTTSGATLSTPGPVTVGIDPAGNLFIGSTSGNSLTVLPKSTGTLFGQSVTANTLQTLKSANGSTPSIATPFGMAIDAAGDVFVDGVNGNAVTVFPTGTATVAGMNNGAITIQVPSGWTTPQTTSATAPGYTTASAGTVTTSGQTITVSGLTLSASSTITVTYGDTSGGTNPGAEVTAPTVVGSDTFTTQEKSTAGGTLTTLAASPSVNVYSPYAPDGSGTNIVLPSNVGVSTTNNTQVFTYTAPAGTLFGQTVRTNTAQTLKNASGSSITLSAAYGEAIDSSGDLFIANYGNNTVTVVPRTTGIIFGRTYTANTAATLTNGNGTAISLNGPVHLVFDTYGDLYISNFGGNTITVLASASRFLFGRYFTANTAQTLTNGNGTAITLSNPRAMAFDSSGDLFIASSGANTVVVLPAATGTLFGQAVTANTAATLSAATGLSSPTGLVFDQAGDLFVDNWGANAVVVVPATSHTIFGESYTANSSHTLTSGTGGALGLNQPYNMAIDSAGNLYVASLASNSVIVMAATTTTLFGQSYSANTPTALLNGNGSALTLSNPLGLAFDQAGDLFIGNNYNNTVTMLPSSTGPLGGLSNGTVTIQVPAGWTAPQSSSATSPGYTTSSSGTVTTSGQLITISGLTMAPATSITITYGDTSSGAHPGAAATAPSTTGTATWTTQEASTATGTLTNLAVSPTVTVFAATTGDGLGTIIVSPTSQATSSTGDTETFTYTPPSGTLLGQTVAANTGKTLTNGNGTAISLSSPRYVLVDKSGDVFISNYSTNSITVIPKVTSTIFGETYTANTAATLTNGNGTALGLSGPDGMAFDAAGNLYVSNLGTSTITVLPVATGTLYGQNVTANIAQTLTNANGTSMGLNSPRHIAFDSAGDLFVANYGSYTVTVLPATTHTIFGETYTANTAHTLTNGTGGSLGLNGPVGLTLDAAGDLFVTDYQGNAVTVVPAATGTIFGQSATANTPFTLTNIAGGSLGLGYPEALQFDSAGNLYIANGYQSTVTVLPAATGNLFGQAVTANTALVLANANGSALGLSGPIGLAFDNLGDLFIVNANASTVTLLPSVAGANGGFSNGAVTIAVPAGWTAPQATSATSPGYTTSSQGTVTTSGQLITVSGLSSNTPVTIVYGNTSSGAHASAGATAPATPGVTTWTTQEKSTASGTLTNLAVSPTVTLYTATAPDGAGTNVVTPTHVVTSSTNNTETFTYTAPLGTIFANPVTPNTAQTLTNVGGGSISLSQAYGEAIDASGDLFIANFSNNTITVIPKVTGTIFGATYTADVAATLTNGDGSAITLNEPAQLAFDSSGDLFIANYGSSTVTVLSSATRSVFGQTITANTATVFAPGGTALSLNHPNGLAFDGSGNLFIVNNGSNAVTVVAQATGSIFGQPYTQNVATTLKNGDGSAMSFSGAVGAAFDSSGDLFIADHASGAVTVIPSATRALFGQFYSANTAQTLKNGNGTSLSSLLSGPIAVAVDSAGDLFISNNSGNSVLVLPAATGTIFGHSYSAGVAAILVNGSGSTISLTSPNGLVFDPQGDLYIAGSVITVLPSTTGPTGGLSNGTVTIAVPSGWTAPQTTSTTSAGYTTSSGGTVSASGQLITISGLTLGAGASITITYGNTSSGANPGAAATAPSTPGTQTWTTQEKSTASGTLTNIAVSPTVTVGPYTGAVTVTASSTSIVYGSAVPTITAAYNGLAFGTSILGTTCTTTYVVGDGAGNYPSTCAVTSLSYSDVTFVSGVVTVTPVTAQVIVTASSSTITYGAAAPTTTASYSGLVGGDASIVGVSCSSTYVIGHGAGSYTTSCSGPSSTANYSNIVYHTGTLTVARVTTPVVVTAISASISYSDPVPPTLLLSATGLVNGDTATSIGVTCSTTYTVGSPGSATYPVTCSGGSTTNYSNISYVAGVLTVTPTSDPVTVTAASSTITYGTATPTISDIYNGLRTIDTNIDTTSTTGPITCSTTYVTGDAPGTYPTTCTGPSSTSDYASILYAAGSLTVTKVTAPVTITASSTTISYGAAAPTVTGSATGLVNGDTVSSLGVTCSTTYVQGDSAGTYPSVCSGGSTTDYSDLNYVNGVVTVSAISTPVTVTASSATISYGSPAPAPTAGYSTLAYGTSIPGITCSNSYVAGQGLGNYATTCTGPTSNTNYTTINYVAGNLTVSAVTTTLNVAASSPTVTYGGAVPTITPTYTGLVNGDSSSVVTGTTCSTTYVVGDASGTYPTSCTGATASNYSTITYTAGVLTVGAVTTPLTITASSTSLTYGTAAPTITAGYAGLASGTSISGVTCSTTYVAGDAVGTYATSCTGPSSNTNYATINYVTGLVTVTPVTASLTITASSPTISYGAAAPTITAGYSGLVFGSSLSGMTCSSTYVVGDDPGTYQSTCSVSTPNYSSITYVTGNVTVTQVTTPVVVTASSPTVVFGATAPTITASYSGLAYGNSLSGVSCSTTYVAGATGTATTSCTGPASNADYASITYSNGTLTIAPSTGPVTITASSASVTYGAAAPTITASYSGLAFGSSISGVTCSTTYVAGDAPGTYTTSCSGSSNGYSSLTFIQGTVTVTPVTAQVTITASSPTITYGSPASSPTANYTGLVNGDSSIPGVTCTSTYVAGDAAGTYPTTCSGGVTTDYSDIVYLGGTLTVARVSSPVTVTGLSATITATDPVPSNLLLSATGLVNGDTASSLGVTCTTTYTTTSPGSATYPVICSGASTTNYSNIVYVAGTLTVTPTSAPVDITATSSTITYGAAVPAISDIFNLSGAVESLITGVTCSTTYVQGDAPGSYPTSCSGGTSGTYSNIVYVNGSLTVTAVTAPVTITASSPTISYGATAPTVTASSTGLVNGDTATSLGATCHTSYVQGDDAGTYPTICSGAATTDYTDINYLAGTLTVSPVTTPVTVTASSPTITYGGAAPTPTAGYTGLAFGSSINGVVCTNSFTPGEAPGTYTTTCTGPSSTTDYTNITYNTGTLTVSNDASQVTITAPSVTITYGDPVPTLPTPTTTGLVNGDTALSLGITCSNSYVVGDAPGNYQTTCTVPSSVTQYSNIHYVAGNVTVMQSTSPVVITATSSPSTITAGTAVPTLSGVATGLLGTDTPTSIGVTCSTTYTTSSTSGLYPVTCTGPASNADYATISYVSGSLIVNPAPITTPPGNPNAGISISTTTLPGAVANQPYSVDLTSAGSAGFPTTWTATGLPPGLSLSSTGVLSGTPATPGTYSVTLTATSDGVTVSETLALVVSSAAATSIDAVTHVGVVAGDTQALVTFTPPANAGDYTHVTYAVTAEPGDVTCETTTTTCLVTGLTNGTAYTFSVVASATSPVSVSSTSAQVGATPTAATIVTGSNGKGATSTVPPKELTPGTATVTRLYGVTQKATVAISNMSVTVTGDGITMSIAAASTVSTPSGFTIELVQGGIAKVHGTGFLPNTLVDVYVFSHEYLLGTATVNASGSYSGSFRIPLTLTPGNHTVLSQGFVKSGARASVSLGVVVESKHQGEITLFPYAVGSAALTPTMIQQIAAFALLIKKDGATKVVVSGYTDINGSPAYNLALGEQRATTAEYLLRQFLVRDRVAVGRIVFVKRSLGSTAPAASNKTVAGQARNRNVTVVATLK